MEERGRRFLQLARERFQFLEDEYGFEYRGFRDEGFRSEARLLYKAPNNTVVRVVKHHEYSEEILVEVGHGRKRVDVEHLAQAQGASRRRLLVEGGRARAGSFADALEYNAALLRECGDAVLRGDTAPFREARRASEQGYELAERIYAALARRGLEDDAGVAYSMVEAEVGAGLGKLTAATGAPPSREETRELVRESVFRWSPLLARFRPTFRRRIDEAADEILDFWTLWLDDEEMRPPRFEPAPP